MGWVVNTTPRPLYLRGDTIYVIQDAEGPEGRPRRVRIILPQPAVDLRTVMIALIIRDEDKLCSCTQIYTTHQLRLTITQRNVTLRRIFTDSRKFALFQIFSLFVYLPCCDLNIHTSKYAASIKYKITSSRRNCPRAEIGSRKVLFWQCYIVTLKTCSNIATF